MSLTSSLYNALSGLRAVNAGVGVTSNNLANALTPGFHRRSISVSAFAGGGVRTGAIDRYTNAALLGQILKNTGQLAHASTQQSQMEAIYNGLGLFSETGSLNARMGRLKESFNSFLANQDQPDVYLQKVLSAAKDVVQGVDHLSHALAQQRTGAQAEIRRSTKETNTLLLEIHQLNKGIVNASGDERATLEDQRDRAAHKLAELLPVQFRTDKLGKMTIQTETGISLLNARPRHLEYESGEIYVKTSPNATTRERLSDYANGPISGGILGAQLEFVSGVLPEQIQKLDDLKTQLLNMKPPFEATGSNGPVDLPLFVMGELGSLVVNPALTGESTTFNGEELTPNSIAFKDDATINDLFSLTASLETGIIDWEGGVAEKFTHWQTERTATEQVKTSLEVAFARDNVTIEEQAQALSALQTAYEANAQVLKIVDEMQKTLLRI